MSEEQISREEQNQKVKTSQIDKKLEEIEEELQKLEPKENSTVNRVRNTLQQPVQKHSQKIVQKDPYLLFVNQVPEWTKKPFMYIIPKNEKMKESWMEKWSDIVLLYCRTTISHVISIEQLRQLQPFNNSSNGKKLSIEQMRILIDYLISKELARWLDDSKIRARIYYKSLQEFAEMLLKYILDRGLDTEYLITLNEFRNFGQEWSSLPDEDLDEVFRILEEQKKIRPIDRKRDAFSFDV